MTLSSFLVAAVIVAVAHGQWTNSLIKGGYEGCELDDPTPEGYPALHLPASDNAALTINMGAGFSPVVPVDGSLASFVWSPALINGELAGGADYTVTISGLTSKERNAASAEAIFLLGANSGIFSIASRKGLVNCARTRAINSGVKEFRAPLSGSVFIRVIYGDQTRLETISATITVAAAVENVDCAGTWSACTAACDRTFTTTTAKSGTGAVCPAAVDCQPGTDACPATQNVDCAGTWSTCTAACDRTFTTTTAQSGTGAVCPAAVDCQPGTDACPDWATTFAACTIGDQKAKCPNDPAKCVSDLTSDELISVCGEFKKKGTPCETDPLALQSLSAPCATCKAYTCSAGALLSNAATLTGADDATCCDDTDIASGSTTISASILAFVGSFVILLA